MGFDFAGAVVPVDDALRSALEREWRRLAAPGTWLSGEERVAVAAEARAARTFSSAGTGLAPLVVEVAQCVSAAAGYVDRDWVRYLWGHGLGVGEYVEIVGVVGRLAAVDTLCRGVGVAEAPLPTAEPGEPSRETDDAARLRAAYVPTAPEDRAPYALSAVPAEAAAVRELEDHLYLTKDEMADPEYRGALTRVQIEFLAARVSYLNECFY